jgi:hypothetical protein
VCAVHRVIRASSPNISRSSSRWVRLYWSCIEMNFVHPFRSAACCILANCHAHIDEAPMYPDFAGLDHIVQGLHRLVDGGFGVEALDLQQIDVVGV